jgi:beta-galactosidase
MKRIRIFQLVLLLFINQGLNAKLPDIGAEIWIEPGNTKEQIFQWMEIAAQHQMSVVRIFAMWTHVEAEKDVWNFDIYDWIFEAAEKYGIKMQVTLNANQPPAHYGRQHWSITHTSAIFSDERILPSAAKYIERMVKRYRNSPAMETWWLMNEPTGYTPFDDYAFSRFKTKMKEKYKDIRTLNQTWVTNFTSFEDLSPIPQMNGSGGWSTAQPYYDWIGHCADHLTDFQKWVHDEVMKYDTKHAFHTNPTTILSQFHMQQTSKWKPFLNSLGSSIHASWHLAAFDRAQYTMGIAAMCEMTKANAFPNPFWVSELQAGNNTFSGNRAMCPTYNDIAQWTWTGIGQGAEKIIYWCLNPRLKGNESGEWSMVDFLNRPTERLVAAASIIECLKREKSFFDGAKPVESNVSILISPESNLLLSRKKRDAFEGTKSTAHIFSALACFEALAERGISSSIVQTQDFDWESARGKVAILPNALCIPQALYQRMKSFVANGNKLIMTGMTGHFDEYENNMFQIETPVKEVFGAELSDFMMIDNAFEIQTNLSTEKLPVHGWIGIFKNNTATPVCSYGPYITGIRNKYEKGEVLWIPCNIELGGWLNGNSALSELLFSETSDYTKGQPFIFAEKTEDVTMQTMYHGDRYVTVVNNGTDLPRRVKIVNKLGKTPHVMYATHNSDIQLGKNPDIEMKPRECLVISWSTN